MTAGAAEPFVAVPLRVHDSLKRGELSLRQYSLLVFLCGEVDFRTGEAALSLRALSDGVQWDASSDWLRKSLLALRDLGWIDYDSWPGQQKPYVIRLAGAALRKGAAAISDRSPARKHQSDAAVISEPQVTEATASPSETGTRGSARSQTEASPQEEKTQVTTAAVSQMPAELLDLLEPLGPLTPAQLKEASTAWAEDQVLVARFAKAALAGKKPPGLFLTLLRQEGPGSRRASRGPWFVDVLERHPTEPDLDQEVRYGPYDRHGEAVNVQRRFPKGMANIRRASNLEAPE